MTMHTPAPESSHSLHPRRTGEWRPDPALFFSGPAQLQLMERLRELIETPAQVALVKGARGSGKTTLVFRLLGEVPAHWLICRVDANPMMHPDQLLNALARSGDLTPNDPRLMEQIPLAFAELHRQGLLPLVVVDDADQLPSSSLMALLRLHEQRVEGQQIGRAHV
jgi:type II secretory pathway predicted ATPase ExeA